jgi:hypothetical protein
MVIVAGWIFAWSVLAVSASEAGPAVDASRVLMCAASDVMACEATKSCTREFPENVNLPALVKIDTGRRRIEARDGSNRAAEIASTTRSEGQVLMQGAQNGRGWNIAIAEDTGRMSVVVVGDRVGFVVFGTCTHG